MQAYSPLGSDGRVGETLNLPVVKEIAAETGLTPAQVIISWHVQRGVSACHLLSNASTHTITDCCAAEECYAFENRRESPGCVLLHFDITSVSTSDEVTLQCLLFLTSYSKSWRRPLRHIRLKEDQTPARTGVLTSTSSSRMYSTKFNSPLCISKLVQRIRCLVYWFSLQASTSTNSMCLQVRRK